VFVDESEVQCSMPYPLLRRRKSCRSSISNHTLRAMYETASLKYKADYETVLWPWLTTTSSNGVALISIRAMSGL